MKDGTRGIVLLLLSLCCLGTWPALLRLGSSDSRRNISHVYIDYATIYFIVSCFPLLGSSNVSSETHGTSILLVLTAFLGGSLLSMGNLSLQWSTVVYGAPLTTVLAIQASMTVTIGTVINYLLEESQTPRPLLLFVGVVFFLVAISFATRSQLEYTREKLEHSYEEIEMHYGSTETHQVVGTSSTDDKDTTDPRLGVMVASLGGLCFGFFSPAFNIAVHDTFDWTDSGGLSVVTANAWFAFSFFVASVVGNIILLHRENIDMISIVYLYLREPVSMRRLAWSAGLVCAVGNILQFQGGKLVGYATSDLVQAYPLVSTFWDVVLFGEFKDVQFWSSLGMHMTAMYISYILGVSLLAASSFS